MTSEREREKKQDSKSKWGRQAYTVAERSEKVSFFVWVFVGDVFLRR